MTDLRRRIDCRIPCNVNGAQCWIRASIAVIAVFTSACQSGAACNGWATSSLEVSGSSCDECALDFGAIEIGLQAHQRIDLFWGCGSAAFEPPKLIRGDVFRLDEQGLPPQPGLSGFVDVAFTPINAGEVRDAITFGSTFKAELSGTGVVP